MSMNLPGSTVNTLAGSTITALAGSTLSGTGSSSGESALVLPATTRDTLGGSTVSTLAGSILGSSNEVYLPEEPAVVIPQYKYFRLVTYNESCVYDDSGIRLFIHQDAHLRDHAQADGFDIFFVDLHGRRMPCELVYYGDGTGEWWLKPASDSAPCDIQEIEDMGLARGIDYGWTSNKNALISAPSFFMVYGDRTDASHSATTADPTSLLWCRRVNNILIPDTPVVAHSSYFINTDSNDYELPYECPTNAPENRPINSVGYAGHSSGWTSIRNFPDLNNSNIETRVEKSGNACCIAADRSLSVVGTYVETIPLYSNNNSSTSLATNGTASALVFGVSTGKASGNNDYGLFAYNDMAVTLTEYRSSDEHGTETGSGWTLTCYDAYSYMNYETGTASIEWTPRQSWSLGNWTGTVGYILFYSDTYNNHCAEASVMSHTIGDGPVNSTDLSMSGQMSFYNLPGISCQDAIHIGSAVFHYPTNNGSGVIMLGAPQGGNAAFMELRSDLPLRSPLYGTDENGTDPYTHNTRILRWFWKSLFDNTSIRTIDNPITRSQYAEEETPNIQWLFNRTKTYQGLAGGCN